MKTEKTCVGQLDGLNMDRNTTLRPLFLSCVKLTNCCFCIHDVKFPFPICVIFLTQGHNHFFPAKQIAFFSLCQANPVFTAVAVERQR